MLYLAELVCFIGSISAAYFTMLHLLGSPHTSHAKLLRIFHRVAGSLTILSFAAIVLSLSLGQLRGEGRLEGYPFVLFLLGSLMVPLFLAKIVIVERYPELRNRLFTIGSVLLVLGYAVFVTGILKPGLRTQVAPESAKTLTAGRDIFAIKCSKCHRLEKALTARKSPEDWELTVEKMRKKDPSWISKPESQSILEFLKAIGAESGAD